MYVFYIFYLYVYVRVYFNAFQMAIYTTTLSIIYTTNLHDKLSIIFNTNYRSSKVSFNGI